MENFNKSLSRKTSRVFFKSLMSFKLVIESFNLVIGKLDENLTTLKKVHGYLF